MAAHLQKKAKQNVFTDNLRGGRKKIQNICKNVTRYLFTKKINQIFAKRSTGYLQKDQPDICKKINQIFAISFARGNKYLQKDQPDICTIFCWREQMGRPEPSDIPMPQQISSFPKNTNFDKQKILWFFF